MFWAGIQLLFYVFNIRQTLEQLLIKFKSTYEDFILSLDF